MWTLYSLVLASNLVLLQGKAESAAASELEGVLQVREDGSWPVVGEGQGRLGSQDGPIQETLRDSRLSGRRLRVKGHRPQPGGFDVQEFLVVRDGRLLRLVYFCTVCNITSFRPGDCDCCREPTEPIEIPPTDPRVYHPEIKEHPPE